MAAVQVLGYRWRLSPVVKTLVPIMVKTLWLASHVRIQVARTHDNPHYALVSHYTITP